MSTKIRITLNIVYVYRIQFQNICVVGVDAQSIYAI
jgi:hypothetical protein